MYQMWLQSFAFPDTICPLRRTVPRSCISLTMWWCQTIDPESMSYVSGESSHPSSLAATPLHLNLVQMAQSKMAFSILQYVLVVPSCSSRSINVGSARSEPWTAGSHTEPQVQNLRPKFESNGGQLLKIPSTPVQDLEGTMLYYVSEKCDGNLFSRILLGCYDHPWDVGPRRVQNHVSCSCQNTRTETRRG